MTAPSSASLPAARWLPLGPAATTPHDLSDDIDLDTRISLAEQRLIAREQRLHGQVQRFGQRLQQAAAPRALLLKAGGVALAGVALVWTLRGGGSRHGHAPARRNHPAPAMSGGPPQWLLSLLPMAWPMLPERWRSRISPATAATVLGVAAPLIDRLLARRNAAEDTDNADTLPTMPQVDLLRYAGTWHEQARLPAPFESVCEGQPRAIYQPLGGRLSVRNECLGANGDLRVVEGVARVVPGSGGARLQVSFVPAWLQWLPMVWADLWILHVDESAPDYRVALVGHPSRKGLWLLSRDPELPADELQRLVALANNLGFNTDRLVMVGPGPTLH